MRDDVRNSWAHCKLDEWSGEKFKACFTYMKELLVLCNLTNVAEELQTWEKKGGKFVLVITFKKYRLKIA